MSQQPMSPTNQTAAPHASETTTHTSETTEGARPSSRDRFDNMSDKRIVSMLRQWVEDAEKDLATHSYFPTLARVFFSLLSTGVAHLDREEPHEAQDADRRARSGKRYQTQPVGIPQALDTTLDPDESYIVFHVVLDAVKAWEDEDKVLPNEAAHRRLIAAAQALEIMANAQLMEMGPLVEAHRADDEAANEWRRDRWFARSQPDRFTPAGSVVATGQPRAQGQRDAGDASDAQARPDTATSSAAPASARDTRSA